MPAATGCWAPGRHSAWGEEDVIRKILGDLISAGVNADEGEVRSALKAKEAEARLALKGA